MHSRPLDGHVALVTGSSTGLGKGVLFRLANAGAKVVMNYAHNQARAEAAFEELKAAGGEGVLIQASAVEKDEIDAMVAQAEKDLGPIDIVVPNATPDQPLKPIEEYDWEFYQSMLDFFVKSPYLLARATLPAMKAQKWGRFINIGSEVFPASFGNFSAYVAAKGGQIGWTRSMATELAPFGITVNVVNPGWIPTERHVNDPQEAKDEYLSTTPMQRWGTPEEIGDAVLYFSSPEAGFVSGQTLNVNGARTPW
ncbi:MAG: 3-oxoacyl-[acyl-carrier protein] reductase [Verrucomicrobiales bacterium]|jgi:3-oxoacyl-[acyl-carrier protein] reductase